MRKIIVVTCNSELESAKKLGYTTRTDAKEYAHKFDDTVVIRWGYSRLAYNRSGENRNTEFKMVINPAKSIKANCSKAKSIKLMSTVVNVPTLWESSVPSGVLAVVRPFEHAAGSDFSVRQGPFKLEPGFYACRFLETRHEYRVWFCGNRTMCARRVKMQVNETTQYACRSNWGYEFIDGINKDLRAQTLLAAKKIGLESGAADVLFYKDRWYFLELNSAPSLDHRVVREWFQKAVVELIDKKFSENPFPASVPVAEVKKKVVESPAPVPIQPAAAPVVAPAPARSPFYAQRVEAPATSTVRPSPITTSTSRPVEKPTARPLKSVNRPFVRPVERRPLGSSVGIRNSTTAARPVVTDRPAVMPVERPQQSTPSPVKKSWFTWLFGSKTTNI
jgi:hypothetical protein